VDSGLTLQSVDRRNAAQGIKFRRGRQALRNRMWRTRQSSSPSLHMRDIERRHRQDRCSPDTDATHSWADRPCKKRLSAFFGSFVDGRSHAGRILRPIRDSERTRWGSAQGRGGVRRPRDRAGMLQSPQPLGRRGRGARVRWNSRFRCRRLDRVHR